MIKANNQYVIRDGEKKLFASTVKAKTVVRQDGQRHYVDVQIIDSSTGQLDGVALEFTSAELNAFTAVGGDSVAEYYSLVELAVKDYLENISDNSGVTFELDYEFGATEQTYRCTGIDVTLTYA